MPAHDPAATLPDAVAAGSQPITTATLPLNEEQWMGFVASLARTVGWKVAHFRPALRANGTYRTACQYDAKGFPDLVLIHPERGIVRFVECKDDKGRLSDEQKKWSRWLVDAGADWDLWQPRDREMVVRFLTNGKGSL